MKALKINKKALFYGLSAFLFLYAFRKVNQGIDVSDTGYHFSNFLYMSEMDPMWVFSTYLASLLGHFFTTLPGGESLLGIQIYTTLLPAVLGVISFWFFVKVVKLEIWKSFIGVLVALSLCWCPTTCVYNYLTYLLFVAGAILLYQGLTKDKVVCLVLAGVALGANVLVRFPNLAEAALILVVWYSCFLEKAKFGRYVQKTGYCLAGYLLGAGLVFIQISIQYGFDAYVEGIMRLFAMTDTASDYTAYAMVLHLIEAYIFSGRWLVLLGICVLLGTAGFHVLPGKFLQLKKLGYVACCLILVRWLYGQGMFSLDYNGFGPVLNWSVMMVIGALLLAVWVVFSTKSTYAEKLLAAVVVIVIGITPLGSNNQLYANLNNMFLVAPFVLYELGKLFVTVPVGFPMKAMSLLCVAMVVIQCFIFGNVYVFRDLAPRNTEVTNMDSLQYMQTNAENGALLEELGEFAGEASLAGQRVLLFGDVPGLSAYLGMPFVMSPWPDLPSYTEETFRTELEKLQDNISEQKPVIIFGSNFYNFLTNIEENVALESGIQEKYGYKLSLLLDFIQENNYECTFINEGYVILQ